MVWIKIADSAGFEGYLTSVSRTGPTNQRSFSAGFIIEGAAGVKT